MGFVFKTIRQVVGDSSEEVCYHFEVFEDFMAFEKQEKSENVVNEKMINTPPVEESEYATHCDENIRSVTEIVEGEEYRITGNDATGHDFSIGDIVVAKEHSGEKEVSFCEKGDEGWYVHVSEVEKVK